MGWKRCSSEGNRSEAADILRSLIDRIELRPNQQGKLEIDLYGDLAGIPTLARKKAKPLDQAILSVQQSPTWEIGDRSRTGHATTAKIFAVYMRGTSTLCSAAQAKSTPAIELPLLAQPTVRQ